MWPDEADRINTTLQSYVGFPFSDLALKLGPPVTEFEADNGRRAFQWEGEKQEPGAIVPIGTALIAVPPQKMGCRVSVVARTTKPNSKLGDWIIERWEWSGAGC